MLREMVRSDVQRLMPTCAGNVVESQILNFQARYAAILDHRRSKPIRPIIYPEQERMLDDIWQAGYLGEDDVLSTGHSHGPQGSRTPKSPKSPQHSSRGHAERRLEGWRRIGLGLAEESGLPITSESDLFRDVGALGLECLVRTYSPCKLLLTGSTGLRYTRRAFTTYVTKPYLYCSAADQ